GVVRTDALDTFAGATVRTQPLDDSRRTTPAYGSLRAKLDKSDAKIKKIEESLDQLEKNVRMFIEAGYAGPALKDRKRLEKQREAVPRRGEGTAKVRPFGVNMFSGLYFDAGDFTAGLALTYIPDVMKGFGLECEAGYIGMAGAQEGLGASLNLLYLPDWGNRVFIPYFAAGAGIIYTSNAGAGLGKQTDPAANLGGGVFFPMSNKFSLRADARLMCRFEEDTKKVDGRFYLALHCGF
ncbi:MAG: hypothetical protein U9P14_03010, partial [Gemmatimonadota bacterium]|nr:hypothetical protein [Gemmatimonadota bacterium]